MVSAPSTFAGALRIALVLAGVIVLGIVGFYAVNALLAMGVVAVGLVVVGILLWGVGGRLWDWFRHGKPLVRGDWSGMDGDGE